MASQLTIAVICLLLVAQLTQIQAPIPAAVGAVASAAAGVIAAGSSLAGTTIQGLSSLNYRVTMGMEVENWTKFEMMNPFVSRKSGAIVIPPVWIRPAQKEAMVTRKTGWTATGTWGVVSWYIATKLRRVVIMWEAPYDHNYHSNRLAVGITKGNYDHRPFWADQMYDGESDWEIGFDRQDYDDGVPTVQWIDYETGLTVSATMSTTHKAIVKVIFSSLYESDLARPIRDNLNKQQKK